MAPLKHPLTIYQGATFRFPLKWSAGTPSVPVDLTGCTARMHIREKVESPDFLLSQGILLLNTIVSTRIAPTGTKIKVMALGV